MKELLRLARLTPKNLVMVTVCEDYEEYHMCRYVDDYSRKKILKKLNEELSSDDLNQLKSFSDIKEAVVDLYSDNYSRCYFYSLEEYNKVEEDERRERLESAASDIARNAGVKVSSLEFIQACHNELERQKSYRYGLQEDRLCIGYGVTHQQWQEEYNYSVSESSEIKDILEWLREACPLLWCKWEETRLQNKDEYLQD